jgi:ankyrin repeat protein
MLLLDRGAEINARAVNDWTTLGFALANNRGDMAELLRARGGIE